MSIELILVTIKLSTLRTGKIVTYRSVDIPCFWSGEYLAAVVALMHMLCRIVLVDGFVAVESSTAAVTTIIFCMASVVVIIAVFLTTTINVALAAIPSLGVTNIAAMLVGSKRVHKENFAIIASSGVGHLDKLRRDLEVKG
jgi:hypothetical protein